MPIRAACPSCSAVLNIGDQLRGKKVRCKKCSATFVAAEPEPSPEAPQEDATVVIEPPAAPSRKMPPQLPAEEVADEKQQSASAAELPSTDEPPSPQAEETIDDWPDSEKPASATGIEFDEEPSIDDDSFEQPLAQKNEEKGDIDDDEIDDEDIDDEDMIDKILEDELLEDSSDEPFQPQPVDREDDDDSVDDDLDELSEDELVEDELGEDDSSEDEPAATRGAAPRGSLVESSSTEATPPSSRQRFRYRFDSFMAKGGTSIFLALIVVFTVSLAAVTLLRSVLLFTLGDPADHHGFFRNLYILFLEITDPGNMAQDLNSSPIYKITAIIAGMAGVIVFSMVIAFITTALDQKLQQLKKGHSKVIESGHTLILGWNDRVVEILRELVLANESESNPCVVILSEQEKEFMDDYLSVNFKDRKNTRIVTRSGGVSSLVNLDIVSVATCKSVIVLAHVGDSASERQKAASDTRVLKTVLGIMACKPQGESLSIVAELFSERNQAMAEQIAPGEINCVNANEILAKILVQTSRSVGLSVVYGTIMSFDGCEMYFHNNPDWAGLTFGQLQFHFPDGVPLGIRRDGDILINPEIDTVMQGDDDILILAEDDSTVEFRKKAVAKPRSIALKPGRLRKRIERELLIGWNPKVPLIIREYGDYVLEGSSIDVLIHNPDDAIRAELDELKSSMSNVEVSLIDRDPMKTETLVDMDPTSYDNIIILSQGGEESDPETTDSETIVILLLLRQIFTGPNGMKGKKTKLISEVMDSNNQELIARAGVKDFIISNRFVSMLFAQISEEPDIKSVYDNLFSEDGSEIYLKPASLYIESLPKQVTYADLMGLAQRRQEICLGVKIKAEERDISKQFGVRLIPPKDEAFTLHPEDSLVVLAEDEM